MKKSTDSRILVTSAQIASLTIANAFIFQELLANSNTKVKSVNKMLGEVDFLSVTVEHWKYICNEINYVPIFHIARELLLCIPVSGDADKALRTLARITLEIISERAALRHDLMGRIYHRLLLEAKFLGTYYTSVPSAVLLSKLALSPGKWNLDWSDLDKIKNFRAADLACGTGTLLMAANLAIADNFVRTTVQSGGSVSVGDLRQLHKTLIENVLYGYDVLASAVHLTASTLAMLAPEITFKKMCLYILPLGKSPDGSVNLGSIDYLKFSSIRSQLSLQEDLRSADATKVADNGTPVSSAPLPMLDLAIMNPPFVRSVGGNLLFGSIKNREKLQKELKNILHPVSGPEVRANSTAGLGSVFTAVAHNYIKNNGRIALVLPAAVLTGDAWQKTRSLISSNYSLEYVVTSHDPNKWSFSENTELSEVLLVARKIAPEKQKKEQTIFANLWHNPETGADAFALAQDILGKAVPAAELGSPKKTSHGTRSLRIGNFKYGESLSIPFEEFRNDLWMGGAFAQTALCRSAWFLSKGFLYLPTETKTFKVPLCKMSDIGTLGPDRRDIYDAFTTSEYTSPYPAFWSHKAKDTRTMSLESNMYLEGRTAPAEGRHYRNPALLWSRAGKLMLAERMWFTTQSVFCIRLPKAALSNVWWPFAMLKKKASYEKALAIWLNSTLGTLSVIAYRVPTRGPWVQFKKPNLNNMPVLDVYKLTEKRLKAFSELYDDLCHKELKPLPMMGDDEVRREIDERIATVLRLPDYGILRNMLAKEPIITGKHLTPPSKITLKTQHEPSQASFEIDLTK